MATVTGLTADRMLEIEAASVVDGEVIGDHLILTKHDGTVIDAGSVVGPAGPVGPAGSALSVLAAAGISEPGLSNQRRAGHVLALTDFTTLLGLSAPAGLWNLTDLSDISGNARALNNKGAVTFGRGIMGATPEAAVFTGSVAQALYIADTGAADPFRLPYGAKGCWFKTAKRGVVQALMTKWNAVAGQNGFWLGISGANTLFASISTDGNDNNGLTGFTDVCDDKWHHVVLVWDGTVLYVYLDAKLEAYYRLYNPAPIFGVTAPLNIGAQAATGAVAAVNPFYGRIDEAFVTSDVLDEDQIRMLYSYKIAHGAAFTPTKVELMIRRLRKGTSLVAGDFTTNPLHLYNLVNFSLADAGSLNNALNNNNVAKAGPGPDGVASSGVQLIAASSQYLSATDAGLPAGTSARSAGCWFKIDPLSTATFRPLIFWGTVAGSAAAELYMGGAGSTQQGQICWGSGTNGEISTPGQRFDDGQWHHVVATYDAAAADGLKFKIYVDGQLVASSTVSLVSGVTLSGANGFKVGYDGGGYWNGNLSRVFVTNYALSREDVAALFNKGALSLGVSPKNEGDHVERVDATNVYMICDTLEAQNQIDLLVSS